MEQNIKKNITLIIVASFLLIALFDGWPYRQLPLKGG